MSSNAKSTLARLLAKENITVQHGNFTTAFFDVQSRVLGLPAWKDMSKDVYDLMIGHEVGHALYTPADFHRQIAGIRHEVVNLVEDVRIERMVQDQYPGLVACFTRGYQTLNESDFFGIKGTDVNSLGFMNRLNLKFKLRRLVDIKFSDDELPIKAQIESASTWAEVVAAARALQDFVKARQDEQKEQQTQKSAAAPSAQVKPDQGDDSDASEQDSEAGDSTDASASDDSAAEQKSPDGSMQTDEDPAVGTKPESESTKSETAPQQDESSNDGQASTESDQNCKEGGTRGSDKTADDADLSTQANFDSRCQNDLTDVSRETLATQFLRLPTQSSRLSRIVDYKRLHTLRMDNPYFAQASALTSFKTQFEQYIRANKPVITMMVKEFELRKSAHQYSRATVSKTGSLNLEKLHSYRTSDDIFLSVTKLADAKNHAMVMFVDYSGSMAQVLPHVLKHLINMALFCRQAGIPFKVYAFNTGNYGPNAIDDATLATDYITLSNMVLIELVSSDLSKDEFNQALYAMWLRTVNHGARAGIEELGGTPLNEAIMIAHDIIDQFKARHNPDKMTAIFLTDGVGGRVGSYKASHLDPYRRKVASENTDYSWSLPRGGVISVDVKGRNVKFDNSKPNEGTAKLIENLRITTGCNTMGFFIPARRSAYRFAIRDAIATSPMRKLASNADYLMRLDAAYSRDSVVCIPGGCSYDQYFVVGAGKDLAIDDDDELEVDPTMSRSKIAREFMNFSSSKKSKRVFVTKFSEAIA